MLTDLVAEGSLPMHWVTCDEGFGVSPTFLDSVAGLGLGYLAEVDCNTHIWTARPEQGGSPCTRSSRPRHNWSTLACAGRLNSASGTASNFFGRLREPRHRYATLVILAPFFVVWKTL